MGNAQSAATDVEDPVGAGSPGAGPPPADDSGAALGRAEKALAALRGLQADYRDGAQKVRAIVRRALQTPPPASRG